MFSIIVAVDENLAIGKNNRIPWKCEEDLNFFKCITENHTVVMGRKTYDSIGKPLNNRKNIVFSKTLSKLNGVTIINDLEKYVEKSKKNEEEIFIIGGHDIYKYFLENKIVFRIYISYIYCKVENPDCYFFDINEFGHWKIKRIYYGKEFKNVLYERDCTI